jgi:hypothetical protein
MGKVIMMTDGFGQVRKIGMQNNTTLRMWKKKEHFFRKGNGWGLDLDWFHQLKDVEIFIVEVSNGERYLTTREAFEEYGEKIQYPGHGEQLVVPMDYWVEFKE